MALNKLDKSFKTLINKKFTTPDREFFQEDGADTLNIHARQIWVDEVSEDSASMVASGTAVLYEKFSLTQDGLYTSTSEKKAWHFISGSGFDAGNMSFSSTSPEASSSYFRSDFISDKFGVGYRVKIYHANDSQELSSTDEGEILGDDPINWYFDYKTGVLHVADPLGNGSPYSYPLRISIFKYDGLFLNENIQEGQGGLWTGSADEISRNGNVKVGGNLTVEGTAVAQEFHAEFVSSSIIYESGSTKFGDTEDDIHEFTGSMKVSGSMELSGSFDITGELDGVDLSYFSESTENRFQNIEAGSSSLWTLSGDGSLSRTSDVKVTGSMIVSDTVWAKYLEVSSSIIYDSGSTRFGDSIDDTHQMTGSLILTGSISAKDKSPISLGTSSIIHERSDSYLEILNSNSGIRLDGSIIELSSSNVILGSIDSDSRLRSYGHLELINESAYHTMSGDFNYTGSITLSGSMYVSGNIEMSSSAKVDGVDISNFSQSIDARVDYLENLPGLWTGSVDDDQISRSGSVNITGSFDILGSITSSQGIAPLVISKHPDEFELTIESNTHFRGETTASQLATQNITGELGNIIIESPASFSVSLTSSNINTDTISSENDAITVEDTTTFESSITSSDLAIDTLNAISSEITVEDPTNFISSITASGISATEISASTERVDGDLTVGGTIYAETLEITYISSSINYSTGSNKFGDELEDKHEFTGSVQISASLEVDGNITSTGSVNIDGNVNISESASAASFSGSNLIITETSSLSYISASNAEITNITIAESASVGTLSTNELSLTDLTVASTASLSYVSASIVSGTHGYFENLSGSVEGDVKIGTPDDGVYTDGFFDYFSSETFLANAIDDISEAFLDIVPSKQAQLSVLTGSLTTYTGKIADGLIDAHWSASAGDSITYIVSDTIQLDTHPFRAGTKRNFIPDNIIGGGITSSEAFGTQSALSETDTIAYSASSWPTSSGILTLITMSVYNNIWTETDARINKTLDSTGSWQWILAADQTANSSSRYVIQYPGSVGSATFPNLTVDSISHSIEVTETKSLSGVDYYTTGTEIDVYFSASNMFECIYADVTNYGILDALTNNIAVGTVPFTDVNLTLTDAGLSDPVETTTIFETKTRVVILNNVASQYSASSEYRAGGYRHDGYTYSSDQALFKINSYNTIYENTESFYSEDYRRSGSVEGEFDTWDSNTVIDLDELQVQNGRLIARENGGDYSSGNAEQKYYRLFVPTKQSINGALTASKNSDAFSNGSQIDGAWTTTGNRIAPWGSSGSLQIVMVREAETGSNLTYYDFGRGYSNNTYVDTIPVSGARVTNESSGSDAIEYLRWTLLDNKYVSGSDGERCMLLIKYSGSSATEYITQLEMSYF